jgi:hypothetical protein
MVGYMAAPPTILVWAMAGLETRANASIVAASDLSDPVI